MIKRKSLILEEHVGAPGRPELLAPDELYQPAPAPVAEPISYYRKRFTLFDASLLWPAVADAFRKLDPRVQWRSPVMFVVYAGSGIAHHVLDH